MRQFFIDELSPPDVDRLHDFLRNNAASSSIEGLYWVVLSQDILDPAQFECREDHPFCFAVEVGDSWAKFEFLIRSRSNMNSLHTSYASQVQQRFILDYSNRLIEKLNLST